MQKILIIDDDLVLSDVVAFFVRRVGYHAIQAHDGQSGLSQWREEQPDIVLLDLNLPDMDGFEVLARIRQTSSTPVILMTARDGEEDVLKGFDLGADDYLTKPFSVKQLVVRIRAVLRRVGESSENRAYQTEHLTLDPTRRELTIRGGETITLTPKETRLMGYLMVNANTVLTHDAIIDHVWGAEGAQEDTLRQLIYRLRSKLETNGDQHSTIVTVPRTGYRLEAPE